MTRAEFTISYAETIGCRIQGAHVHEVDCGLIERWKKGDKLMIGLTKDKDVIIEKVDE